MHCTFRVIPFFLFLLSLLSVPAPASAQTLPPREPFRLNLDCARFRGGDDSVSHVEVYYSFPRRALSFRADSVGFSGAGDITLLIKKADSLVFGDRWLVPHILRDTSVSSQGMSLVGNYSVQLPGGDYILKMIARDRLNAAHADSVSLRLPIRPYRTDKVMVSDIEFAGNIRQGTKGGPFYKNTLDVVPNVGGLFHENQKCFFYAEVYNLLVDGDNSDVVIRSAVYDAVGKEMMSRERSRKRVGESTVIVDNFGVDKMRSGTYTLALGIMDSSRKALASVGKKFFIYNPTLGIDSSLLASATSLPMQEYMSMEEPELDREFKWAKYEASDAERAQFSQIKGLEPKRKFLSDFWRHRQPGHRDEYLSRVTYANNSYQVLGREGYRTDRGRVYIVYGPPDDVERHPNETETRPYEIWQYNNIQGGVIFVFVLRNAGGDHELVHSTHRNEIRDDNWDRVGITR